MKNLTFGHAFAGVLILVFLVAVVMPAIFGTH